MDQVTRKKYCQILALDIDPKCLSFQKDKNTLNNHDRNHNNGPPLMIDSATSLESAGLNGNNFIFTSFFEIKKPSNSHFSSSSTQETHNDHELITKNVMATHPSPSPYRKIENLLNYEQSTLNCTVESIINEQEQANERIPRPPNAFILYRRANQSSVTQKYGKISNARISQILSKMWKDESEEVKFYWHKEAAHRKNQHEIAHPNYVYQPKRLNVKGKLNIHLEMIGS
ncbi:1018_t:CDS:1 [Ambispora gerdemannii]|uniref:1018_t:CDS:1 n=1 Tax=Ambispora gerdemannii TaxID=144530 RepID=A0A9N9CG69_9GLOM|nr:1018_t:CDS:1 [Ambispora gerdemannii]